MEETRQWIKVTDRLPDHRHFVWIALANGEVSQGKYISDKDMWISLRDAYRNGDVTHWMEKMPEPVHPSLMNT